MGPYPHVYIHICMYMDMCIYIYVYLYVCVAYVGKDFSLGVHGKGPWFVFWTFLGTQTVEWR